MHLQTHTCSLLPPSKLLREPALQQHHKHSLVHSIRSISSTHQAEWDRPGDTERVPRSQGRTGKRRSCHSGNAMVLPEHCHRAVSGTHPALWGFAGSLLLPTWHPALEHWLYLSSSAGVKATETCHSMGRETEQSTENLQQQNGSFRKLLQKRLCWGPLPPPQTPWGCIQHWLSGRTEWEAEGSPYKWHIHIPWQRYPCISSPLPSTAGLWPTAPCSSSSTMSLTPASTALRFLYRSAKYLSFSLHFSNNPVAPDRPKTALFKLFLGHWQKAESLDLPSWLISKTGIQGCRCLDVKKQISTSPTHHTPLQNLVLLYLHLVLAGCHPEYRLSGIYIPVPHTSFSLFKPFSLCICRGSLIEGFMQRVEEGRRKKAGREKRNLTITGPCNQALVTGTQPGLLISVIKSSKSSIPR